MAGRVVVMARGRKIAKAAARLLALLSLAPALGGCVAALNDAAAAGPGVSTTRDLQYASGDRHGIDVYQPHQPSGNMRGGLPVVVFIYGGSWQEGKRADYRFVGAALARHGYLTFIPDYRLYPQAHYPDFIRDTAQAVRFAQQHAAQYGGDPHKLVLVGHSAGSYMVAMLALDPRWLHEVGMDPVRDLRAAVGLAGPYDFLPLHDDKLAAIFTTPAGLPATQPINYVSGVAPPMLLLAGRNDKLVDPGNSERLAAAIRAKGGDVSLTMYPRAAHTVIIGAFAPALRFLSPSFGDTVNFIDAHVQP
ncbi:MAG: alpha/beta hydrolase [Janthinobacterium lividum]